MEKRRPHYKLTEVQALVADPASQPFTVTALRNGLAMGLTEPEMPERDFYKAMTSHADHQVWQDVYHGMTEEGIVVYIKITAFAEGHPPIIQFKAK